MGSFQRVAALSEVPPGAAHAVEVDGQHLALFNVDGELLAVDGECTHAGGPLCEGDVEDGVVTCPWHAATFELGTGKALTRPATLDLHSYPARVEGEDVLVELD